MSSYVDAESKINWLMKNSAAAAALLADDVVEFPRFFFKIVFCVFKIEENKNKGNRWRMMLGAGFLVISWLVLWLEY